MLQQSEVFLRDLTNGVTMHQSPDMLSAPAQTLLDFLLQCRESESDIVVSIERQTGSNYHPTSTWAIGKAVDPNCESLAPRGCASPMRQ